MNTATCKAERPAQASHSVVRVGYLDGWRGVAIALVLESHFLDLVPVNAGRLGVDIFFCLSGFLMSGLLFVNRQPLTTFYKRRISRIIPVFLLAVTAIYLFAYFQNLEFTDVEVASTFLFLRTYIPIDKGIWDTAVPIRHLWSLNIEEHCYIFMSMIVLFRKFKGREGIILIAAGLACMGVGVLYARMGTRAPHWGELGTEVASAPLLLAAGYRLVREKHALRVPPWVPLLVIVLLPFCYAGLLPWWGRSLISPFLLAFSINHVSQTYEWFKSALSIPALRYLGIWSYSLYLWQQPFYNNRFSFPGGPYCALAAAFAVALLSFYAWEQPVRTWLNRNW